MRRRDFLSKSAATLLSTGAFTAAQAAPARTQNVSDADRDTGGAAAARIPRVATGGTMRGEMLFRSLGSTGVELSVIGMGGSHLGMADVPEDLAIRLIHQGLDRGINFLDNAWNYNERRSEERVGKALAQDGYRKKAFVMTKLDGRTKEMAAQIDASLKRLKTD
jgi:hypothetical protein